MVVARQKSRHKSVRFWTSSLRLKSTIEMIFLILDSPQPGNSTLWESALDNLSNSLDLLRTLETLLLFIRVIRNFLLHESWCIKQVNRLFNFTVQREGLSSGGKVALVVVFMILIVLIIAGGVLYYYRRRGKAQFGHTSFDNPVHFTSDVYSSSGERVDNLPSQGWCFKCLVSSE